MSVSVKAEAIKLKKYGQHNANLGDCLVSFAKFIHEGIGSTWDDDAGDTVRACQQTRNTCLI